MPGYELERFVDLTQIERAELTCSICQDIFRCPVVTSCCLQTFCEECIIGWINASNTCPFDRKKLKVSHLLRPPRLLLNMLGNLKISCPFKEKGCDEIMLLENHDNHLIKCRFNKKLCKDCECEILDDHNCVRSLLEANKYLKQSLNTELVKNEILSRKLHDLKLENENFLQTLQNLSNSSPLDSRILSKLSDHQILVESRKYLGSPILNYRSTSEEMRNKIFNIIRDVIISEQNLSDVCKNIKELVESEFDGLWHCSAFYDDYGCHCFTFDDVFIVSVVFGKLKITVHKVYDDIKLKKLGQLLRSGKLKEEIVIEKTDMNDSLIAIAEEITINSIKTTDNLSDFAKTISKEMAKKLDGVWQTFVFRTFLANCYVCPKIGRFINLTISDLNVVMFQV